MEQMKAVTRYQCQFCKKDFKTPDRHYCKFNPELRNCFTCKNLKGWEQGEEGSFEWGVCKEPNYPDCASGKPNLTGFDIELIKELEYNMQCERWEEGEYDWFKKGELL